MSKENPLTFNNRCSVLHHFRGPWRMVTWDAENAGFMKKLLIWRMTWGPMWSRTLGHHDVWGLSSPNVRCLNPLLSFVKAIYLLIVDSHNLNRLLSRHPRYQCKAANWVHKEVRLPIPLLWLPRPPEQSWLNITCTASIKDFQWQSSTTFPIGSMHGMVGPITWCLLMVNNG